MPINLPLTPDEAEKAKEMVEARRKMIKGAKDITAVEGLVRGGAEAVGKKVGNSFVKRPKTIWTKNLYKKGDTDAALSAISSNRNFEQRLLMKEMLAQELGEDIVPSNRLYVKPKDMSKGAFISITDSVMDTKKVAKKAIDRELIQKIKSTKVGPGLIIDAQDLHGENIIDGKIIDTGFMKADYETEKGADKFQKALKSFIDKDITSPTNKRLTMKYAKELAKKLPVVSALVGLADYLSGNKDALADTVMPFSPSTMGNAERGHTGRKPDSEGNRTLNRQEQAASLIYELLDQEDEQSAVQAHIKKTGVEPATDSKVMMLRKGQQLEANRLQMRAIMNETGMTADEVIDLVEGESGKRKLKLIDMYEKGDLEGLLWEEQRTRKPKAGDFNKSSRPSMLGREELA